MSEPKNYKETLNLPATDFPMKARLAAKEPEYLHKWEHSRLYQERIKKNKNKPFFILHDGPPYVNSPIHIGTALNKILKDIVVRYKNVSGFLGEYVPGFDCHGLPIELAAVKKLGSHARSEPETRKKELSALEIRQLCREHARKYIAIQTEQFKRLGVWGEWQNPYLTMSFDYEAAIVRELATLAENQLLHRGKKVIHWCASCQTALAEAEIAYEDKISPSIYVQFRLSRDAHKKLSSKFKALAHKEMALVIWTTTPWTLPANRAIALHPELKYAAMETEQGVLILADKLAESVKKTCGIQSVKVLAALKAEDLAGLSCDHPFLERQSLIILGDHVTAETGSGCVHTAPGHGADDYYLGIKYKLDIFSPVDHRGRFTSEMPDYQGQFVFDTDPVIIQKLKDSGHLLHAAEISHAYPHCWRCKKPVFFRATEQWFVLMDQARLRTAVLQWIKKIKWIPGWGEKRIRSMMENRPDWCISRQRVWGVPIPALHCKNCAFVYCDADFMRTVAKAFEKEGGDFWFAHDVRDLLPEGFVCPKCHKKEFVKETDILDVWFDSGCSFAAVLESRKNLRMPADLYLEGSDQHRGWFHTSLIVAVGTRQKAPYRACLTHGFVVDGQGRKMSKSLGNVIEPEQVIKLHGAEILRLWVASENYQNDINCSDELLKRVSGVYRKIRNTCKHILGNISDFNPQTDSVPYEALLEIDRYMLSKLQGFIEKSKTNYEGYEFHGFFYDLNNYCVVDLSSFYLDILKDRLYTAGKKSKARRAAQTALYEILSSLIRIISPILIFTAEEVYEYLPGKKEKSVHLLDWPKINADYLDKDLEKRWEWLIILRSYVAKAVEEARNKKLIGSSLEARVIIAPSKEWQKIIAETSFDLSQLFIVSQVELHPPAKKISITVEKARGQKCPRCWIWSPEVTATEEICGKCKKALA